MSKNKKIKTGAKAGAYSAVLTVIVITAAIIVNLIVAAIPTVYTKIDTSANSVFTFDKKTEAFVSSLSQDVTVYHVVESGAEDKYLSEILERYSQMNSHINVKQIDPAKSPSFIAKYTEESLASNSLIVVSGERYKVVPFSEIYYIYCSDFGQAMDYETFAQYYSYYQYQGVSLNYTEVFAGENAVVSGIDYVTTDSLAKVYILTGHGESALVADLTKWLDYQNYSAESLDLTEQTGNIDGSTKVNAVPSDAGIVIINAPTSDISEAELESLTNYVKAGGKLLVSTNYASTKHTNLRALAAAYGLDISTNVLFETDTSYYSGYAFNVIAHIGTHSIVSGATSVGMPSAHGIKIAETMPEGMSATKLLYTSDSAYAKPLDYVADSSTYAKAEGDIDGPFALGVLVECKDAGSVIWYSSNYYNTQSATGETTAVYANSVSYLCDKTDTISVHTIDLTSAPLSISLGTAIFWGVMTTIVVPFGFVTLGFVIWLLRRKK